MSTFLVTLREGVEAALIVAIVLAGLRSPERSGQTRWVWGGVAAAVVAAAGAGAVLQATVGSIEGRSEEVFEGVVALSAVIVLTWMVFFMAARAASLRSRLRAEVAEVVGGGGGWALAAVGFVAVLREGLETALFLIAAGRGDGGMAQVAEGLAGLAAAAGIGFLVYRGGRRFDLRLFFRVTGWLIIVFAAGLLAKAVHAFAEAGLLPALVDPVWDLGWGDPPAGVVGRILAETLGWTAAPSLLQVVAYWAYLLPVSLAFWRRLRPPAAATEGAVDLEPAGR